MIKKIKTELLYYFGILVVLAFLQHPDLLTSPLTRIELMANRENYFHPFLWVSLVYVFVVLLRLVIKGIVYLKNKSVA